LEEKTMNWKTFAAASCLGLMTMVPSANADQWNKRTILTVNEPIQVPGKVLQPGKYVMRLMDSPSNRHIVQIFNEREDQLQTTILAIPNYRLQPTGNTEFQWWETPAGQPRAMRAWFYPGDNFGQEFAYPKNEAVQIAASTNTNVPTTYAESQADLATARVGTVDRAGTEMELDRSTYNQNNQVAQDRSTASAAQPEVQREATVREQTQIAQNRTTPTPAAEDRMTSLPRTASPMPMFGLAGLLALGAGMAFRAVGRN
jgi:hypothetical protein